MNMGNPMCAETSDDRYNIFVVVRLYIGRLTVTWVWLMRAPSTHHDEMAKCVTKKPFLIKYQIHIISPNDGSLNVLLKYKHKQTP